MDPEESHGPNAAPQQSPQDIPSTVIGGDNSIGHEHERRANVVRDDAHADIVVLVGPIATT